MVYSNGLDASITQSFADVVGHPRTVKQEAIDKASKVEGTQLTGDKLSNDKLVEANEAVIAKQDVSEKSEEQESIDLEEALNSVSEFMNLYSRNVNFSRTEDSNTTIIKVYDADSDELIKQFPSEDLIDLAKKINELRQDIDLKSGIFLDEKA